jgi:hypothetical protein
MPVNLLTCARPRGRNGVRPLFARCGMLIRCVAPTTGMMVDRGAAIAGAGMIGAGVFVPSGGSLDALPIPLGSLSTLGLAGPNGTPLIGELPAPADPAGGVSCASVTPCAHVLGDTIKLASRTVRTTAKLRDIAWLRDCSLTNM